MILYKKRTTKVLIRQSRSAGRSAPLVFATLRRQVCWHWGPYNRYKLPIITQMGTTCNSYGFSHMGPCTTVAKTLSVPFGLLLWEAYYIPHVWKKCVSRAINSHFNQRIIKAIHVLLIHHFWTKRIHSLGTSQEVTSEKWVYIRFGLSVIPSFCLPFCPSVIISFTLNFIEFTQFCMCIDIDLFFDMI